MSGIAIYMEGGGNERDGKAKIRLGMNEFLKEIKSRARSLSWGLKIVLCGGRDQAFRSFSRACRDGDHDVVVLLVDSEGPVNASPHTHLAARDGWDLGGVADDRVHLMVQTMETWIVADPQALAAYYGRNFRANALPSRQDLEEEDKGTLANSLEWATERTQKGRYHKIRHAADLLALIDPTRVRARCRHGARLFDALDAAIAAG